VAHTVRPLWQQSLAPPLRAAFDEVAFLEFCHPAVGMVPDDAFDIAGHDVVSQRGELPRAIVEHFAGENEARGP
jgi:hypothetical protein